ncbi:hypothetical protein [Bacillus inaquosorum]|nr:hypothetical protein [Bacillus inaquosorum]MDZ5541901.1 hypothetical protein [Bacillus inaquosorum]CAF1851160.1 hypothetical protein NRS6167_02931 [Bacillus subtilis]CAI6229420.1 hypothetical protein NRS6167_02830 [Bacillus subtilis]
MPLQVLQRRYLQIGGKLNAGHVDLYDKKQYIPFYKLESFFEENLKKK